MAWRLHVVCKLFLFKYHIMCRGKKKKNPSMVLCTYLYIRPQMLNLLRLLQRFWMWLRFRDRCSSSTPKWGQAFLYWGVVILKQEKDKPNSIPQERKWCFSSSKINLLNKFLAFLCAFSCHMRESKILLYALLHQCIHLLGEQFGY